MPRRARRNHDQNFKTRVVLEAFKEQKTLAQLSAQFELHPNQITDWKKQAVAAMPTVFGDQSDRHKSLPDSEQIELITAPLYQQIGQLKVEVDFLKKKLMKNT